MSIAALEREEDILRSLPGLIAESIGRNIEEAEASLRLSIGWNTTQQDVEKAIETISKVVNQLRKI